MSDVSQHEQLLSAYLDGRLNSEDQQQAEKLLAEHPEYVALVDQWREQGAALKQMPKYRLDAQFADRVLKTVDAGATVWPRSDRQTVALNQSRVGISKVAWRSAAAAILTLAGMMMLTLFLFPAVIDSSRFALSQSSVTSQAAERTDSRPAAGNFAEGTSETDDEPSYRSADEAPVATNDPIYRKDRRKAEELDQLRQSRVVKRLESSFDDVLVVKLPANSMAKIEKVLTDNQIKIQSKDARPILDSDRPGGTATGSMGNEMQAVLVRCSPAQIKNAIEGWSSGQAEVAMLSVPMGLPTAEMGQAIPSLKSNDQEKLMGQQPRPLMDQQIAANGPTRQRNGAGAGGIGRAGFGGVSPEKGAESKSDQSKSQTKESTAKSTLPTAVLAQRNDGVARQLKFNRLKQAVENEAFLAKKSAPQSPPPGFSGDPIPGFFENADKKKAEGDEAAEDDSDLEEGVALINRRFNLVEDPNQMRNYLILIQTLPTQQAEAEADATAEPTSKQK